MTKLKAAKIISGGVDPDRNGAEGKPKKAKGKAAGRKESATKRELPRQKGTKEGGKSCLRGRRPAGDGGCVVKVGREMQGSERNGRSAKRGQGEAEQGTRPSER